jgi:hypothetical protein
MATEYFEFLLRVESYEKVRVESQGGGVSKDDLKLASVCRQIARFENLLRAESLNRSEDFRLLGSKLYQCLFHGNVERVFLNSLKAMENNFKKGENPRILRLQLDFEEDVRDLAGVPWEFLYRPDSHNAKGFFFVTHPHLVLSRYISLEEERPNLCIKEDSLRFLVVISKPKTLGRVLSEPVVNAIKELETTYEIRVKLLKNPTRIELQTAIEKYQPHILHFIGHGKFDWQKQRGELALLQSDPETPWNERETPLWITDETFAEYFRHFQPQLVLLQACQGGEVDFTANYAGLAPQLTRMKIPAVIAMQYPVSNLIASTFSQAFYKALASGELVDVAMQEGRKEVALASEQFYSSRDFGTPVLYMNSRDGAIMPRPRVRVKFKEEALLNSRNELEAAIVKLFNQEELLNLAFDLSVKYEQLHEEIQREAAYRDLSDQTQRETVRALINCVQRNGQLKTLVQLIKEEKPDEFD